MPDNFTKEPDVQYKAHEVLIARAALLQRDTEAATKQIEELQGRIDEALDRNRKLAGEARKAGNNVLADQLASEEQELLRAWSSLDEAHGNMHFGYTQQAES